MPTEAHRSREALARIIAARNNLAAVLDDRFAVTEHRAVADGVLVLLDQAAEWLDDEK